MTEEKIIKVSKELTIPLGIKVDGTDMDYAEALFIRGAKWMHIQLKKESS